MEALYGKAVPSVVPWALSDRHNTQPGDWADWVSLQHSIFKGCIQRAVWWRCKRDKLRGTSRGRCGWAGNTEQSGKFPPEKTPKAASTQAASREKSFLLHLEGWKLHFLPREVRRVRRTAVLSLSFPFASVQGCGFPERLALVYSEVTHYRGAAVLCFCVSLLFIKTGDEEGKKLGL